jgi:hypothetical protein
MHHFAACVIVENRKFMIFMTEFFSFGAGSGHDRAT